jgi:hypothetical protein
MSKMILDAYKKYECCATELEEIIDLAGIHVYIAMSYIKYSREIDLHQNY